MTYSIPPIDGNVNHAPHVVILGAGASIALTLHNNEKNGKLLPSMLNLVEIVGLEEILLSYGVEYDRENFESLYSKLALDKKNKDLIGELERKIRDYFSSLELPYTPTIYDYLILSLRKKDMIATFNWDPFLAQAYARCSRYTHELPQIAFLHGNVETGVCMKDHTIGYVWNSCSLCGEKFKPTNLLYPVENKNYSQDPVIQNDWDRLRMYLKEAYYLTIFGYSAPVSDAEAKELMLNEWKNNKLSRLNQVNIIDIQDEEELHKTWKDFILKSHYGVYKNIFDSYLFQYPRRSCDAFSEATLMLRPKPINPFQKFDTMDELYAWVKPLIDEEIQYESKKTPFSFQVNNGN